MWKNICLLFMSMGVVLLLSISIFIPSVKKRKNISVELLSQKQQGKVFLELFLKNIDGKQVSKIKTIDLENRKAFWENVSYKHKIFFQSIKMGDEQENSKELILCNLASFTEKIKIGEYEIEQNISSIYLRVINCNGKNIFLKRKEYYDYDKSHFVRNGLLVIIQIIIFLVGIIALYKAIEEKKEKKS